LIFNCNLLLELNQLDCKLADWEIAMIEVGTFEMKNHLSALLARVEGGEEIMVTRRGKPVALITQPDGQKRFNRDAAIKAAKELGELSKGCFLGKDITLKDLINDGRR
jgi:prevent-host-death family protein